MKKIGILCFIVWCSLLNGAQAAANFPRRNAVDPHVQDAGEQIIGAVYDQGMNHLRVALKSCEVRYKNNPELFEKCLTALDEEGWTPLMHAVTLARGERALEIVNSLARYYGDDYEAIARIINARDPNGKTAIYLAAERRHTKAVKALVSRVGEIFKDHKEFFFEFLTVATKDFAWNPLFIAVYDSASDIMTMLVEYAQQFLGIASHEYMDFINAQDAFGRTAISLSIEPRDRLFLLQHGAKDYPSSPIDPLARKLMMLIEEPRKDKELKAVLDEAEQRFKYDLRGYLDFITARDNGGWTPLMNAVADGHAHYVNLILNSLSNYFKDKESRWWIAFVMNNADNHGRTSFHLAITRRQFHVAQLLLEKEKEIFGDDKHVLFLLLNQHTEFNGFTPLIIAAYISSDDENSNALIKKMVARAGEVFGKNSLMMDRFINAQDLENRTALSYVLDPATRDFMRQYGANTTGPKP